MSYCLGSHAAWNILTVTATEPFGSLGDGQESHQTYGTGFTVSF